MLITYLPMISIRHNNSRQKLHNIPNLTTTVLPPQSESLRGYCRHPNAKSVGQASGQAHHRKCSHVCNVSRITFKRGSGIFCQIFSGNVNGERYAHNAPFNDPMFGIPALIFQIKASKFDRNVKLYKSLNMLGFNITTKWCLRALKFPCNTYRLSRSINLITNCISPARVLKWKYLIGERFHVGLGNFTYVLVQRTTYILWID